MTNWQHKVFTKLLGLQYKLCYRKGVENIAADALSRRQHDTPTAVTVITACQAAWLDDVRASYATNAHATAWISKLQLDPDSKGRFSLQNDILYFRNRIWLRGSAQLQTKILTAFHSSAIGGHSGFLVTYKRIRRLFA